MCACAVVVFTEIGEVGDVGCLDGECNAHLRHSRYDEVDVLCAVFLYAFFSIDRTVVNAVVGTDEAVFCFTLDEHLLCPYVAEVVWDEVHALVDGGWYVGELEYGEE